LAVAAVLSGAGLDMIEALFGPAMGVVSSLLRACIVAGPGSELVSADFAQIEARVLPWLAGQMDVLEVFRRGEDIYKKSASGVFDVPIEAVDGDQRQVGKVATLALGFGG